MSALTAGFANQLTRESAMWWATRRWWVQTTVWGVLVNALLAVMLWVIPDLEGPSGQAHMSVAESAAQFTGMAATLTSIATVVLSQGLLVDERRSGVLEWMLSKPMERTALLAAKLVGHAIALVAVLVIAPWAGVLLLLSLADGSLWQLGRWAGATALVAALVIFHLALVLLLSVVTWSRPVILAVPLAGILGADLATAIVPDLASALPWTLARLAGPVLVDGSLPSVGPMLSITVLTTAFLLAGAWWFEHEEL